MVGIRHSVATATAFLKTTLTVEEGRFRFISHKFTASNLRYQARRMNNRSYVTEQTTALHLIYQKFNYLRRKHPLFPWQGTVLIVALATIVCRVSEANRILSRQTFINSWRTKLPNRSIVPFVANTKRSTHHAIFPWQGTVGWALGCVSTHKRSVCRVSEANRTRIEIAPTAVVKSRQLPWYTLCIHCTYTYEFCRYRQN